MDKFLFFDFKRSKIINVLIIIQLAIWIFYSGSLISLIRFDESFRDKFFNSFSTNNSTIITFVDLIRKNSLPEDQEENQVLVRQSANYIKDLNLSCGMFREADEPEISLDEIGMDLKDIKPGFIETEIFISGLKPMYMNSNMVEYYKDNINGSIKVWQEDEEEIPVILGDNFRKKYKLEDVINVEDRKYKVTGFFNRDIISFDYNNIISSEYSLNGSMIIPVEDEKIISGYNAEPMLVYTKSGEKINLIDLMSNLKEICEDVSGRSVDQIVDEFLEQVRKTKQFETIRILLVTLVVTSSIIVTILYKISLNKDRIGVLFAIGISKAKIFRILVYEVFSISAFGMILGDIIYLIKCKNAHGLFLNENYLGTLFISIFLLIVIIVGSLAVG